LLSAEIEKRLKSAATGVNAKAAVVGPDVRARIDAIITSKELSYRDALAIQFAFSLVEGVGTDVKVRRPGGRGVAGWFGKLLTKHHIRAVADAFQNIGKNTDVLARGNFPAFDDTLGWASSAKRTRAELQAAFGYICGKIAATARPVRPAPRLNRSALTFAAVCQLLTRLYDKPSGGASEQFSIAALLHAVVEQTGVQGYRVDTKNLNASDKSSRTAGDIQIISGTRVIDAWEVTANDWQEKLAGAAKTIKDNDLTRLTIVSGKSGVPMEQKLQTLRAQTVDLSVLDVREFAFSLVAGLTRQGRAAAIARLYELLDRHQPDVEKVNYLVAAVEDLGLVDDADNP